MSKTVFDVIVVGGGHAGNEAAYISARMGVQTALISLSKAHIGLMPCNPSVGGLGKGHIVYEVSALGGLMPEICTESYLQARLLNTRKGPAVQGLRLQIDKYAYKEAIQKRLAATENLTIIEGAVVGLCTAPCEEQRLSCAPASDFEVCSNEGEFVSVTPSDQRFADDQKKTRSLKVTGVIVERDGVRTTYSAAAVVVTAGTFLNGVLHIGDDRTSGGRRGEAAEKNLSHSLTETLGCTLGRLKTGTPPRLLRSSINFSVLERQEEQQLDYLFEYDAPAGGVIEREPCHIAYTTPETHAIIARNILKSAMYSGNIVGVGPRYCPSIEDKVGRYPDRESHHVFVEPEGYHHHEMYPSGLSTSLPLDVQEEYIASIPGFEKAVISQPGYAVEYDFVQPTLLTHSLETKTTAGLFFAGQINGTTGYEEAAGQGVYAGINAARKARGEAPFILSRHESYIGVMIDDLVTLGVDEPYRMFTSRAERRLLLRQDTVFKRLMPYGYSLGTVSAERYAQLCLEEELVARCVAQIQKRTDSDHFRLFQGDDYEGIMAAAPAVIRSIVGPEAVVTSRLVLRIYAELRYAGYIVREEKEVAKLLKFQKLVIPGDFDYRPVDGLSFELKLKLEKYRPASIAQAELIPGMTPAALSLIIYHVTRERV